MGVSLRVFVACSQRGEERDRGGGGKEVEPSGDPPEEVLVGFDVVARNGNAGNRDA